MATTKTLTPTNQTITIDAFQGEKPDHRHVADAEGKLADAVNALNSQLAVAAVTFTSYDALKSGIQTKAGTMASGSIASFDFRANFSTTEELPNAYYTCIIRKYDNNSYLADIISNTGADYKLSYAGNAWRLTALSSKLTTNKTATISVGEVTGTYKDVQMSVSNSDFQLVKGSRIEGSSGLALMGVWFNDDKIQARVRNVSGGTITGATVVVIYC